MIHKSIHWVVAVGVLGMAGSAFAHHRDFAFMRDWYLPHKGEHEIESRTSFSPKNREFMQEFEFELGITDHFAIEPGFGFHGMQGEKTHFDEWDIEARFNFGDFAYNKVLAAMNLEYEHPADDAEPTHGEIKFIFSMYTPKGEDYSLNLNVGQELSHGSEKESEVHFGYCRPLTAGQMGGNQAEVAGWRGGFEGVFDFQEHFLGIGPTLVYKVDKHFNMVATYMFGINKRTDNHDQLKLVLEYEF